MSTPNLHQIRALYVNTIMANSDDEDHLRAKRRSQARDEFDTWFNTELSDAWRKGAWTGWGKYTEPVFGEVAELDPYWRADR